MNSDHFGPRMTRARIVHTALHRLGVLPERTQPLGPDDLPALTLEQYEALLALVPGSGVAPPRVAQRS